MRRTAWSWTGLCLLLAAGILLTATSPSSPASEGMQHLALGKALGLLALIGLGLALGTRGQAPLALKQFVRWGAGGLIIAVLLSYRAPLHGLLTRVGPESAPAGVAALPGVEAGSVSLRAEANGHFIADALVNGTHVRFIVDTGATDIVLRRADAARLGIDLDALRYIVPAHTANGDTLIALVDLDEVVIGTIRIDRVTASVPRNELSHSLLGMSFLKRLSSFSVDSDRLVMRQ